MLTELKTNEFFLEAVRPYPVPVAAAAEYRRIVLVLDASKESEFAIPRAAELANSHHAELVIIRVFKPVDQRGVLTITDPAVSKQARLDAENAARSICNKLIKQGIAARSYAVSGSDITAACGYIQAEEADLIVVAQPTVTRWKRLFGNPMQVFQQRANVSVLFVSRSA